MHDRLFSLEDLQVYCQNQILTEAKDWEKKVFRFILDFLDDKEFILQESSGTTGKPKVLQLSKRAMIESAKNTLEHLNITFGQKALLCLPVEYIAGKMMVVRSLVGGLNLYWEEPTSMPVLAKYGKINFCSMVPLQVYNSFSNYEFFKNIETLIIGGSELRHELLAMFRDVPNRTFESYGMAETCSHIALRRISGGNPDKYFYTLPGITVETDSRGCLIVHAPYIENPVITNDVVELIDSTHFMWKARYDTLINTGGIKVKPEELEASISEILDSECAVIGLPDEKLGQKIVLFLETIENISETEVIGILKNKIK